MDQSRVCATRPHDVSSQRKRVFPSVDRRRFLQAALPAAGGLALALRPEPLAAQDADSHRGAIFKSVKIGMVAEEGPARKKFRIVKELGFDGIELSSPGGLDKQEAQAASRDVGLPIHGVVNSTHWQTRLSDPDAAVRDKALQSLQTSLRDAHRVGGSSVLLVPGKVTDPERENHDQVWARSIEQIRKALPVASKLGVRILVENVWNGFCYDHDGPTDQTAHRLAAYIDEIASPWVGVYFDIGNHQKYGLPQEWIRTLGTRIVKLDVKDWSRREGFTEIGQGDVDWAAVRQALTDVGFTGWATAEVRGGDRGRLATIAGQMDRVLGL